MAAASMMKPATRPARRLGVRIALGAGLAAAAATFFGADTRGEAFTGSRTPFQLGNGYVTMEELPRGLTCKATYGEIVATREEWNPLPQWRGEKSYHPNKDLQADENRMWVHFDAEGKVLGRLAQAIAYVLRGKESPLYDPIKDVGHYVIVTNCEKVRVSGKKYHHKLYFRNLSFKPGHTKVERFKDVQRRFPERILMQAIWGMMPKTPSCRRMFKQRLKLFCGPNHLYYHEDPIDYPMHLVKDCTHTQNLRVKDRIKTFVTKLAPHAEKVFARREQWENEDKLKAFKNFLREHMEDVGEEKAEQMELDAFAEEAEQARMDKILAANEGRKIPKKEVRLVKGTNIPWKRMSANPYRGVPSFSP